MAPVHAPVFEAVIIPHRSLRRAGVAIAISVLMVLNTAIAARFILLGAWPVAAFSLLEIPLIVVLLALNLRQARARELIMLTVDDLTVIRIDPAGRRKEISLPSDWLRVELELERGSPRVILSSHGRCCEVGAFLPENNKVSLFEGLRDALYQSRNPRFENPQLRDC